MESLKIRIPLDFVCKRARILWQDVVFGIEKGLFAPESASVFAAYQLIGLIDPPPELVELAGVDDNFLVKSLVERLASVEQQVDNDTVIQKWLYLALAWIFENRDEYPDPLGIVEQIYAEFDYPESVANLVRYMPVVSSRVGSRDVNECRIFENWQLYLNKACLRFT